MGAQLVSVDDVEIDTDLDPEIGEALERHCARTGETPDDVIARALRRELGLYEDMTVGSDDMG